MRVRLSTPRPLRSLPDILYVLRAGYYCGDSNKQLQIRTILNLPVPRIYTYSLDSTNPVGAEYIIEERASGSPLGNLWPQWSIESQNNLLAQLVDFEAKLTSI